MTMYTLWTNWTTLYFVEARGMSPVEANRQFAWIPPYSELSGALPAELSRSVSSAVECPCFRRVCE